ncbi:hypothetical protein AJ87_02310 [Rhizobium yanglingense]|nr:hypothetical protein AJ87_02310 [Rhizobium yanglingense]
MTGWQPLGRGFLKPPSQYAAQFRDELRIARSTNASRPCWQNIDSPKLLFTVDSTQITPADIQDTA